MRIIQQNSFTDTATTLLTSFGANFKQLCLEREVARTHNSTYPKGGVSYSKDTFVQAESSVLRMKFCGKNPALRVAANRWW
jgi:hypothetical protein